MAEFLSDEWIDELSARGGDQPVVAGATIICQHEIAGAPDGKVRFYAVWTDGQLTEVAKGKHGGPDCMIVAKASDALDVLRGVKQLEVAFMQGRVKIDGDYRRLLVDLRAWRTSEAHRALWNAMADLTE